jgi:hypothetical protein
MEIFSNSNIKLSVELFVSHKYHSLKVFSNSIFEYLILGKLCLS